MRRHPFDTRSPFGLSTPFGQQGGGGGGVPANALVIDNATSPASDGDAIVLDDATADEGAFIIVDNAS